MRAAIVVILTLAAAALLQAQRPRQSDPFAADVRPTNALTPVEEEKSFHLPPGFKIQLFAAEPDIQKPLNMAFDSRGRLWVSCTEEYPYAAPLDRPGKDSIRILEDTNGDGRADKTTVFADGLNIPIGIYPHGNGVIAFSIPNIYHLEDTDGDGRADRKTVLYGPFDHRRDTHGLNNAFRRGFDGWVYANHGFNNNTTVKGKDGHAVTMQSGNSYRFRLDGSRIEQFTFGQVNPFGSTFDAYGDLFTADCHTKPITLLLRGGYYDSFGKPHNGLGYVPDVMQHGHESTAIAGTTQYTGSNFPAEFQRNMFLGNVMSSRVNRDLLRYHGSSIQAAAEPDFISTDDPWFRPVDLQIGPDGALYIADFYNKIIGHYEVPLTHPGRDRHRGRIWRVTYVGTGDKPAPLDPSPNLRSADADQLIANLAHPNLGVRMRATDELSDRVGKPAIPALHKACTHSAATVRAHVGWALFRLQALEAPELAALAGDTDMLVRVHAMRMLAETTSWTDGVRNAAVQGLRDQDARVARAAADAFGRHPNYDNLPLLLALWHKTPGIDVHLRYTVRLALFETLKLGGALRRWAKDEHQAADADLLAGVALAVPTADAGAFLIDYLKRHHPEPELATRALTHAARYLPPDATGEELAALAQKHAAKDVDLQLQLMRALRAGMQQRGQADPPAVLAWGERLAARLLDAADPGQRMWSSRTASGQPGPAWRLEPRQSADGVSAQFLSSLPLGERYTGVLRSREFVLPAELTFYLCGHLGAPNQRAIERSMIRLRLAATDEVIAKALPPRNDTAAPVRWDLKTHAGRIGYIEVVDGINAPAFAWLAVGRFDPPVVTIPTVNPEVTIRRQSAAAELAGALGLRDLTPRLKAIVAADDENVEIRLAAARALLVFRPNAVKAALVEITPDPSVSARLRQAIYAATTEPDDGVLKKLLPETARAIPYRLQVRLADKLAESSAEQLLNLIQQGDLSARILREAAIATKLKAARQENIAARVQQLTQALPPIERELQQLLDARRTGYAKAAPTVERGQALYVKHCQACHQIAGQGVVIGPQLDGIGERGLERVLEDTLDPNRNVDPTFRSTAFVLKDGRVLTGLFRRQEGKNLVIADNTGKEISISEDQVEERQPSPNSLMPSNFGTAMSEAEFYDLTAYLLAQRTKR